MEYSIEFKNVDILFGRKKGRAISMLDNSSDRETILKETGVVLGVADVNLGIYRDEIFVLMGLSGSGKSTLLRCINGLNPVTRGKLHIRYGAETINMAEASENQLRELRLNHFSMVFQQFGLLPWATVRENVSFGLRIKKVPPKQIKETVEEKLALVQLSDWADKPISSLSGGMQQRVGLARALAMDSEILLMDEPFSALDPLIREHLQDELLDIQKKLKKTIVFVSHDLNEALKLGDRIAIMKEGKIVQTGVAHDIVFNPINEYVEKFVSNINPLTSLYAGALMKPVDAASQHEVIVGDGLTLRLDELGTPASFSADGKELPLSTELSSASESNVTLIDFEVPMFEIIEPVRNSPYPLIVTKNGKLIGVLDESCIFKGLKLKHSSSPVDFLG